MATSRVTVSANLVLANVEDVTSGNIRYVLDRPDFDLVNEEIITRETINATINSAGVAEVSLWPNSRGVKGSRYKVYRDADRVTGQEELYLGEISVPLAGAPHNLEDLLAAGAPALGSVLVGFLTQAELDAINAVPGLAASAAADAQTATDKAAEAVVSATDAANSAAAADVSATDAAASAANAAAQNTAATNAAIAAGAPLVTSLTTPIPADGSIEILQSSNGTQIYEVQSGSWELIGQLVAPTFDDRASVVAWVAGGGTVLDGQTVFDGTVFYRASAGATAIADMPGFLWAVDHTPNHHGAAADGVTDDDAALTAWAAIGGSLRLLAGTYLTSGKIELASNSYVHGGGEESVLKQADGASINILRTLNATNIRLRDFVIDGNKANNSGGNGLSFQESSFIDIQGITVRNSANDSILIEQSTDFIISHNRIEESGNHGISISGDTALTLEGQRGNIVGNQIFNPVRAGINVSQSQTVAVTGNVIQHDGTGGAHLGGDGGIRFTNNSTGCAATGNTIIGMSRGIFANDQQGITLVGNTIRDVNLQGIFMSGDSGVDPSEDSTIAGNTIVNPGLLASAGSSHGMQLRGTQNCFVTGNNITDKNGNMQHGVQIDDGDGTASGNQVSGNNISGSVGDPLDVVENTVVDLGPIVSPDDTTEGRLLTVGAGGLLSAVGISGASMNDNGNNAFLSGDASVVTDVPTGAAGRFMGWAAASNGSNTSQFGFFRGVNDWYGRAQIAGIWQDWAKFFNTENILGTVLNNDPTTALIEEGSNANGVYALFASGLQICRASAVDGTGYSRVWTYPAAFSAAPTVVLTPLAGAARVAVATNRTETSVETQVYGVDASQQDTPRAALAIGPAF